jgi:hypothetical protein
MGDCYIADIGRVVTGYDHNVFANEVEASVALFRKGTPSVARPVLSSFDPHPRNPGR